MAPPPPPATSRTAGARTCPHRRQAVPRHPARGAVLGRGHRPAAAHRRHARLLVLVLHSKHLHIFIAPINVTFGRRPIALGAAKPLMVKGKPFNLEMVEDLDEEAERSASARPRTSAGRPTSTSPAAPSAAAARASARRGTPRSRSARRC